MRHIINLILLYFMSKNYVPVSAPCFHAGGTEYKMLGTPVPVSYPKTPIHVVESDSDGYPVVVTKFIEDCFDPNELITYDDFRLSNLLKAGVNPKSLHIQHDTRLGLSSDSIDDFNSRVDSIISAFNYVPSSSKIE